MHNKQQQRIASSGKRNRIFCCILFLLQSYITLANSIQNKNTDTTVVKLTVANIFNRKSADHVTVTFFESARGYTLFRKNKNFPSLIRLVKEARKKRSLLQIKFTETADHSLVIQSIDKVKNK